MTAAAPQGRQTAGRRPPPTPPPVYVIADVEALAPVPVAEAVAAMAAAGVRWIQLRAKRLADDRLYPLAEAAAAALAGSGAVLWSDDRADLAALVGAAGVHLGQRDLPPAAARRAVGPASWIGRSTHDAAQLARADADPEVDVVAVGPVFATRTKQRADPAVGLDFVRRARAATAKPLVAIGGIDAATAPAVLAAGADAVAVIGAVSGGADAAAVGEACRRLLAAVEGRR
jgi:thiamine-phosphate pyrophosphorylase